MFFYDSLDISFVFFFLNVLPIIHFYMLEYIYDYNYYIHSILQLVQFLSQITEILMSV